jgi:hypothetical protein
MAPRDPDHNARLLEAAGYRFDPDTDTWKDPAGERALAGAMAKRLTERALRSWIAGGAGRGPRRAAIRSSPW